MKPPKKPLIAPSLTQRVNQLKRPVPDFKPAVAQLKTAQSFKRPSAPPVYRPQPTPRVLQTKRLGQTAGQALNTHVAMAKTVARPTAPPVYRPQPVPLVLQRKESLKTARPASASLRNAVQPKANMNGHPAGTRLAVIQMAARAARKAAKKEEKKEDKRVPIITAKGLEKDDYLFVEAATGGVSEIPEHTVKEMDVRVLKLSDVDFQSTARPIKVVLTTPKPFRNERSDCAIHKNEQRRLPHYTDEAVQPNIEYLVPGMGGTRIVVDVTGRKVYLSYHYGDKSAKEKKVPAKYKGISAFVELHSSWELATLLADADEWWQVILASMTE